MTTIGKLVLFQAAYKGYPSLMQMLIYSGFDPQKPDNFGSSPLHLACISGNLMAVKLLCAKVGQSFSTIDIESVLFGAGALKCGINICVTFIIKKVEISNIKLALIFIEKSLNFHWDLLVVERAM